MRITFLLQQRKVSSCSGQSISWVVSEWILCTFVCSFIRSRDELQDRLVDTEGFSQGARQLFVCTCKPLEVQSGRNPRSEAASSGVRNTVESLREEQPRSLAGRMYWTTRTNERPLWNDRIDLVRRDIAEAVIFRGWRYERLWSTSAIQGAGDCFFFSCFCREGRAKAAD